MASTTFVTNAGALATRKRILAGRTEEQLRSAAQAQVKQMKAVAVALSSGPLKSAALAKAGHPYALRFPAGAAGLPDFVINIQSGKFQGSWHTRVEKTPRGWTITLWNDDPAAKFMLGGGKSKMRARMILDEVVRRTGPGMPSEVKKVCRRAVRQNGISAPLGGAFGAIVYSVAVGAASAASGIEEAF